MRVRLLMSLAILMTGWAGRARSAPLRVVIVTDHESESERLYTGFLQDVYRGNIAVEAEPDRYEEYLSEEKKAELAGSDLIIVLRDVASKDYNGDADFWNEINVPILNHSIKVARSEGHDYWDWLAGDSNSCNGCTEVGVADGNDPIFAGVDISGSTVRMFAGGADVDYSDQFSAGGGRVVATIDGKVAIARWLGSEGVYYDNSMYWPGSARVFFAAPEKMSDFFEDSTEDGRLMLENALLSLLPADRRGGDLDDDGDVDLGDLAILSEYWGEFGCAGASECAKAELTGDGRVGVEDLGVLAASWLEGSDVTAPEPNVMTWEEAPSALSTESLHMAAARAGDTQYGVEYYFECLWGGGADSGWQYGNIFEPNGLSAGSQYSYRAKARDTSGNLNETGWSAAGTARTFGVHSGMADASAGAALDEDLFIAAGDEGSVLCIYSFSSVGSAPIAEANIEESLNVDLLHPETDIEGATWLNDRIFWITSHGRNKDGQYRYGRHQFFATTVSTEGESISVTVEGNYTRLVEDLIVYDSVYNLGLGDSVGLVGGSVDTNDIPDLAPKKEGLNIEGLCATADGNSVLIGLRNPRPRWGDSNKALIIELRNPEAVVLCGESPEFEAPILLDLGGFGIRSMEYSAALGRYLIIAGSHKSGDDEPVQTMYAYNMGSGELSAMKDFPIITPEGMFQFALSSDIQLLSDDGVLLVETPDGPVINKLLPRAQRTFRMHTINP